MIPPAIVYCTEISSRTYDLDNRLSFKIVWLRLSELVVVMVIGASEALAYPLWKMRNSLVDRIRAPTSFSLLRPPLIHILHLW